jgi:hypothetical protein
VVIVKPGLITGPGVVGPELQAGASSLVGVPTIKVGVVAAALLQLAADGSERDTLASDDLVEIAKEGSVGRK